mgnify:CR=1 FL=1
MKSSGYCPVDIRGTAKGVSWPASDDSVYRIVVSSQGVSRIATLGVQPAVSARNELSVVREVRGVIHDQVFAPPPAQAASLNGIELSIQLDERSPTGRQMLPTRVFADGVLQGTDTFVIVDVK